MGDLSKRVARGLKLRRDLWGDADEQELAELNRAFDPEFQEYELGFQWGTITARPGLDQRTRQLCAIASVLALGNFEQVGDLLANQIRGALRAGATPQEVVEVILQTGLFAGLYKWFARKIALRVFREMGYTEGVDWGRPLPEDW